VDVVAAVTSMGCLALFLKVWHPEQIWESTGKTPNNPGVATAIAPAGTYSTRQIVQAWTPWIILSVLVFLWGLPQIKAILDGISIIRIPVPGLHNLVYRVPPVVPDPRPEAAIFALNWLSATGTGIFVAAIVSGIVMGYSLTDLVKQYVRTLTLVRFSLLTISAMMAVGYSTRYSGLDATMGLAFAQTGVLYPIFGTMLGWLGVALTGSDTSSNVLFGSLQRITSEQLGLSPTLMSAANSSGGVMGKMIDAQSIVVATTATGWHGHEGDILRYVFFHSIALAALVGLLVFLQAYVFPFTSMVVR
jgi:lactate permease